MLGWERWGCDWIKSQDSVNWCVVYCLLLNGYEEIKAPYGNGHSFETGPGDFK